MDGRRFWFCFEGAGPQAPPYGIYRPVALAAEGTRFMRPTREHATNNGQTYFVTSSTFGRRQLFHVARWAELFIDTLSSYRGRAYLLHEFVIMPEHFHLLITPSETLERAVQFVKGGFSARVRKELGSSMAVWQVGFSDHRIRDGADYERHVEYIFRNPVGRGLAEQPSHYPYCSAFPGYARDEIPQWLKPPLHCHSSARRKAAPIQRMEGTTQNGFEDVPTAFKTPEI
jgi:putative transposase